MKKLVIGVFAAAMVIASCGGSSSKSSSNPSGDSTTSSSAGSGGGGDDLSGLVAKAKTADFKVTYDTGGDKTQTIAQDGKGKVAFTNGDSITITDGSTTVSCNGLTADATCTDLGSAGNASMTGLLAVFTTAYTGLAGLKTSVIGGHTSSATIAGRKATCVEVSASDFGGSIGSIIGKVAGDPSVTSCVDSENGFLLKYSTSVNDKTTDQLVATEAGSSSPSDFEPPSTPKTLPSLPNITLPNGITIPSLPTG